MTTASSSPGSAAPDCYGTHYTQLLSAAGQQDTAGNMGNTESLTGVVASPTKGVVSQLI